MKFKHFTRKGYALFACLGKEVIVGTLSVATLTHAKADGISAKPMPAEADSVATRSEIALPCSAHTRTGGQNGYCTGAQGHRTGASTKC